MQSQYASKLVLTVQTDLLKLVSGSPVRLEISQWNYIFVQATLHSLEGTENIY